MQFLVILFCMCMLLHEGYCVREFLVLPSEETKFGIFEIEEPIEIEDADTKFKAVPKDKNVTLVKTNDQLSVKETLVELEFRVIGWYIKESTIPSPIVCESDGTYIYFDVSVNENEVNFKTGDDELGGMIIYPADIPEYAFDGIKIREETQEGELAFIVELSNSKDQESVELNGDAWFRWKDESNNMKWVKIIMTTKNGTIRFDSVHNTQKDFQDDAVDDEGYRK